MRLASDVACRQCGCQMNVTHGTSLGEGADGSGKTLADLKLYREARRAVKMFRY